MRTKEEIIRDIEDVERSEFLLQMKDNWSSEDYRQSEDYREQIRELKKELEEAE